jgi:TrmH family RNA methyltransferase
VTVVPVRSRNDEFQKLASLLTNRTKRHRAQQFVLQGVRPITMALDAGWAFDAVLVRSGGRLSPWAEGVISRSAPSVRYELDAALLAELSQKEDPAELLALVRMRSASLTDLLAGEPDVLVALDRPGSPGNLGSIIRSADALGASGIILIGHAVDPYDPQAVRASTGSIFAVPVAAAASVADLMQAHLSYGRPVVGTDEGGTALHELDLRPPVTLLFGNETRGLSRTAMASCDRMAAIPMGGTASSLNLASSVSVVLYEINRSARLRAQGDADGPSRAPGGTAARECQR